MERTKIVGLFGVLTAGFAYVATVVVTLSHFIPPPEKAAAITASVAP